MGNSNFKLYILVLYMIEYDIEVMATKFMRHFLQI